MQRKNRSIDARSEKLGDVENRMIRHRQLVQRQHADHGAQAASRTVHSKVIGM